MSDKFSADILKDTEIVLIDDDTYSLDVAAIVLEFAGANVTQASNGKEGLDAIRKAKPQLVLCDISMPIMDGWEFIKALRDDSLYNELPVVALTAHAMLGDQQKVMTKGFNGYLSKPLDPTTFVKQLLAVLEKANITLSISSNVTKE